MARGCGSAWGERRDGGEQGDEALRDGGVGDDERSDRRVGQVGGHRQLNDREKVADAYAEGREAEDSIVLRNESLQEASGLGESSGAKVGEHRDFGEAVGDPLFLRLILRQADVSQLGVDEDAGGDLTACGGAVSSGEVVPYGAEVVEGDVGEERRAGAVAHGPDAGEGGLEAVVDLDVTGRGGFDSDCFETHVFCVGCSTGGDEDVGALDSGFATGKSEVQGDGFAGGAFDAGETGVVDDLNAFVL